MGLSRSRCDNLALTSLRSRPHASMISRSRRSKLVLTSLRSRAHATAFSRSRHVHAMGFSHVCRGDPTPFAVGISRVRHGGLARSFLMGSSRVLHRLPLSVFSDSSFSSSDPLTDCYSSFRSNYSVPFSLHLRHQSCWCPTSTSFAQG